MKHKFILACTDGLLCGPELFQCQHPRGVDSNDRVRDRFLYLRKTMWRSGGDDDHVSFCDAAAGAASDRGSGGARPGELLHGIARIVAFLRIYHRAAGNECSGTFDQVVHL